MADGSSSSGPPLAVDLAFNGGPERIAEVAREIERREEAGVRGLFVSEARHDPFLSLTLAASATERLHLGTAIALAFARTPMSMAYTAYDLHRISGGRLVLGLGSQIKAHIQRRYDMPWSQPAERMRDYVSALRAIWYSWQTGEALDYRGEFYSVSDRRDDPFTFSAMGMVATGHTEEELADAIAATRRQIGFYASTPAYKGMLEHHGWGDLHPTAHAMSKAGQWERLAGLIDDDILNTFAVVGEPAVAGRLLRERFSGLVERVTVSMPHHLDGSLALDMLAASAD